MLEDIKNLLRITSDDFDDEIMEMIAECKSELLLSGLKPEKVVETDELIRRAIKLYCKTHFGYQNPDFDRNLASYQSLKSHLMVSVEYGYELE